MSWVVRGYSVYPSLQGRQPGLHQEVLEAGRETATSEGIYTVYSMDCWTSRLDGRL